MDLGGGAELTMQSIARIRRPSRWSRGDALIGRVNTAETAGPVKGVKERSRLALDLGLANFRVRVRKACVSKAQPYP